MYHTRGAPEHTCRPVYLRICCIDFTGMARLKGKSASEGHDHNASKSCKLMFIHWKFYWEYAALHDVSAKPAVYPSEESLGRNRALLQWL